ncbi:MAG: hypothetical protein K1X86_11995 [Ignavibacteria bacterium]|nr:hypothetical protein [Ignavibacteria bacterium]
MSIKNEISNIIEEQHEEFIEESIAEILSEFEKDENEQTNDMMEIETEPLCASCYSPLDADEKQTIAYCDKCETTVFIERRIISSM